MIPGLDAFPGPAPRRLVKYLEWPGAPAGVAVFSEDLCTNVSIPDYRHGFPISTNPDRCRGQIFLSFNHPGHSYERISFRPADSRLPLPSLQYRPDPTRPASCFVRCRRRGFLGERGVGQSVVSSASRSMRVIRMPGELQQKDEDPPLTPIKEIHLCLIQ